MSQPLRLLLDQNFPVTPAGMRFDMLDNTVALEPFAVAFSDHARVSTPDWKVYLLAARGGFDAVVTSDYHQLGLATEMVALDVANIGLITWRTGGPDVIVLYGQLLAYMPQIRKQLALRRESIVRLPKAHLQPSDSFTTARDVLGAMRRRDHMSYPEHRAAALADMRAGLGRDATTLAELLPDR